MPGGHHRIHYKTCLPPTHTPPAILSDYKRRLCHFWQDLVVCQESQFYLFSYSLLSFLLKLNTQFL